MSDSNRVSLKLVAESTFGTTPASPTMKALRITGESLKQDTNTTQSQELRSDRQVADLVRVGLSASGSINGELSYGAHDTLLEALLQSANWTSDTSISDTGISATAGSGTYTLTLASGSFTGLGFTAGMWVNVSGFTTTGTPNNGWGRISSVSTTTMVIANNGNGFTKVAGDTVKINQGAYITNGTTFRSFAIERQYADLASEFAMFNGMVPDTGAINVTQGGILGISFGFMGKKESSAAATAATATTAATTEDVMNAVDDVVAIMEGGAKFDVTDLKLNIANNLRARLQVATLGAISIGSGTIDVKGSFTAYYTSKTIVDKCLNFTSSTLALIITKNGKTYVIDLPKMKYSNAQRVGGGINTDVMADMQFQAIREPTENLTIKIQRIA